KRLCPDREEPLRECGAVAAWKGGCGHDCPPPTIWEHSTARITLLPSAARNYRHQSANRTDHRRAPALRFICLVTTPCIPETAPRRAASTSSNCEHKPPRCRHRQH